MINQIFSKRTASECVLMAFGLLLSVGQAQAATIYASGQRFIPAVPGEHDDIRENFIYAIDSNTGIATPVSPETTGLPSALAGTLNQRLLGFASGGQLVEIDPLTANLTPIGSANGLTSTGFDILDDQRGFLIPFDSNFNTQQINALDLTTGMTIPKGSTTEVGDAIDEARGSTLGTAEPFIISLGSVENQLYGVDLDTDSLIHFSPDTGEAAVVGSVGAVTSGDRSIYSGFAALTGVDTNQDGSFDTLFGNVNFIDSDNDPDTPSERLGGIARYNLTDGTWDLVGTNPGVIFFGFASSPTSVPEPGVLFGIITVSLLGIWTKRNAKE
ncbi:PEP-CTERM sorting domain-containing protein [Cyanothece sp. BG0011]|uniref:PEP-CTERM sorting domain-containing protein n=1 Tax=Cyanothece sp. BG0011 TaxID=2082950 RepID=UPI000D1F9AD4|nr:PEP-CTERM sorting domain-containing protein [Cyanothece sp. BG0011]